MRILYIDSFCPYGHLALNRLYISTLIREGFDVLLALKEGYYEEMGAPGGTVRVRVPARFFDEHAKRFSSRFNIWRALRFIQKRVDESTYDAIFFSSYEEISLWCSHFKRPCVLVNHGNVAGLDNRVRRWFARRLAPNATWLVFAAFIRQRVLFYGIDRVQIVPQGLVEPYPVDGQSARILRSIDARIVESGMQHIIFVPSGAKYADAFIAETVASQAFRQYLKDRRILLVIKTVQLRHNAENIVALKGHLTRDQYKALFTSSTCLILHYPASFTYRVSATLMECFSNNKACLLSDIEAFRYFSNKFCYNPFYASSKELCSGLDRLIRTKELLQNPYRGLTDQVPSFARLAPGWRQ